MPFPPSDKSFEGLLKDTLERLTLVERRLAIGGTGGGETPYDAEAGMVMAFGGTTPPEGWLFCDGSLVSRTEFSALFSAIGTTYGAGDGSTTFGLPNYKGRTLVGRDPAQTEFDVLGETGGAKAHTLTIAEMPSHSHTQANTNGVSGAGHETANATSTGYDYTPATPTQATGGGGAHNNLQPYAVTNYIISTGKGVGGGGPARTSTGTTPYDALPGIVSPFAGGTVPAGWLLCDGQAVSRSTYSRLFAAIGTTYGAGDGSSTFNVPDLKGKVAVGLDGTQTEFDTLGEAGGAKTNTHNHMTGVSYDGGGLYVTTSNQLPRSQVVTKPRLNPIGGGNGNATTREDSTYNETIPTLPPYVVTNYIISTGSAVGGGGSSIPALPDPVRAYGPDSYNITEAGAIWGDIPGATLTLVLSSAAWVRVDFGSEISTPNAGTYGMIGVKASGALNLLPEYDQATGSADKWSNAPFSQATVAVPVRGHKTLLLPAGTTTLQMQKRRNDTGATPAGSYPYLTATPLSWAGAPGAVTDTAIVGRATLGADFTTPATGSTTFTLNWSAYEGWAGVWSASAPSRFVLNKPGKWRVMGKLRMTGATSGFGYMNIWKNGVSLPPTEDLRTIGAAGSYPQCHDIITSNGSDYIEFRPTNSNASQNVVAANCLATVEWIGA